MSELDRVEKLESKLAQEPTPKHVQILTHAYKDVAISRRGRTTAGEFSDPQNLQPLLDLEKFDFIYHLANKLDDADLPDHAARLRKQTYQKQMFNLDLVKELDNVQIISKSSGSISRDTTKIKKVEQFSGIHYDGGWIPFVGINCGVQYVANQQGTPLFYNPRIHSKYSIKGADWEEKLHHERRKTFGNAIPKKFTPTPKHEPPVVTDSQLEQYLQEGSITQTQRDWIGRHENTWMGRDYALKVSESANNAYNIIADIEDKPELEHIIGDVIDIANQGLKEEMYDDYHSPKALEIISRLDTEGHSGNSYHLTIKMLVARTLEEKEISIDHLQPLVNYSKLIV